MKLCVLDAWSARTMPSDAELAPPGEGNACLQVWWYPGPGGRHVREWTGFDWRERAFASHEDALRAIKDARARGVLVAWCEDDDGRRLSEPPRVCSWIDAMRRRYGEGVADAASLAELQRACRHMLDRRNPALAADERIPRVIHQVWLGPRPAPERLLATWRERNPTWKHVVWRDFQWSIFDVLRRQIEAAQDVTAQADLMRWCILAREGGVALDADCWALRPLGDNYLRHEAWAAFDGNRQGFLVNGAVGAAPGASLIAELVQRMKRLGPADSGRVRAAPLLTTGPAPLTIVAAAHPELYAYPASVFYPANPAEEQTAVALQLWATSRGLCDSLDNLAPPALAPEVSP